ncbi:MAG: phosphoribosylaminoimidazolesuccinocarboxamide synthase [Myxococcales bacterium]
MDEQVFRQQLAFTLGDTRLQGLGQLYRGKVRDTYRQGDRLVLVTSDRISAFDHVLGTVPFKGEILNRTAAFWFERTKDVAKSHLLQVPDPNVMVARACQPLPIELVVRGYLTGSLWRDYEAGRAGVYGLPFPAGMKKDQRFEQPVITPTTKEAIGKHDEPVSRDEIIRRGLVPEPVLERAYAAALALFARGQQVAKERGLILVDTKYEFGLAGDELLVIDEIHTMDSSRYWELNEYDDRFARGVDQKMLDKENVRQWLIRERGFSGHGTPPPLPDEVRVDIARIYASAYERITGQTFAPEVGDVHARIERNLKAAGLL